VSQLARMRSYNEMPGDEGVAGDLKLRDVSDGWSGSRGVPYSAASECERLVWSFVSLYLLHLGMHRMLVNI
jgi:hypothetical protein